MDKTMDDAPPSGWTLRWSTTPGLTLFPECWRPRQDREVPTTRNSLLSCGCSFISEIAHPTVSLLSVEETGGAPRKVGNVTSVWHVSCWQCGRNIYDLVVIGNQYPSMGGRVFI